MVLFDVLFDVLACLCVILMDCFNLMPCCHLLFSLEAVKEAKFIQLKIFGIGNIGDRLPKTSSHTLGTNQHMYSIVGVVESFFNNIRMLGPFYCLN